MIGRKAVTMLEIVIAAAIIAIAFIPILSSIQYGGKSTVKVNNYSKAMRLAQGLVEETRHVPMKVIEKDYTGLADDKWETLSDQYYPKTMVALNEFKSQLKELQWSGQLKLRKEKVTPGDQEVIKEVWVRVEANWTEGDETFKRVTRQIRLSNAIYNSDSE